MIGKVNYRNFVEAPNFQINHSMASKDLPLTEEQIAEFRSAFDLFDNDSSGTITSRELITAMQNLNLNPREEEIRNLVKVL